MVTGTDEQTLLQRAPTAVAAVFGTVLTVLAVLWVSERAGIAGVSTPGVLSHGVATSGTTYAGEISLIGDSVATGAAPCLRRRGIATQAAEGRQFGSAGRIIQRQADRGTLPERVVVALGANGPIAEDQLADVMGAAGENRRVYFVTIQLPDAPVYAYESAANSLLGEAPSTWPAARVIDWNAVSGQHPRALYPDGIHVTPAGCRIYARMVSDAVRTE